MFQTFLSNVGHNLFKPLLLFFYAGFAIPLLKVKFEFPKVLYQGLTIYLLLAIGWHGGEELASLEPSQYAQAAGFMLIGFATNTVIGVMAYALLRKFTKVRQIDAATVAGYYGSDSAGTFVTCLGVLTAAHVTYAAYMPVMLAIMEIPGCLVALFLISRMRNRGMDVHGNMPGEANYAGVRSIATMSCEKIQRFVTDEHGEEFEESLIEEEGELVGAGANVSHREVAGGATRHGRGSFSAHVVRPLAPRHNGHHQSGGSAAGSSDDDDKATEAHLQALAAEDEIALRTVEKTADVNPPSKKRGAFNKELLHEVFMNPGIFLLFAGITIGFVSRLQGERVTMADDALFINLFQGLLCLFLLEMGMTASKKLKDLKSAGWGFIAFGLLAPNLFASIGMFVAHGYAHLTGHPLEIGTYVLFAVLCGAASYIAVPAVQRMAIPEASPTLPLAASLGLTFSYNVTIGIPMYLMIATALTQWTPVVAVASM